MNYINTYILMTLYYKRIIRIDIICVYILQNPTYKAEYKEWEKFTLQ